MSNFISILYDQTTRTAYPSNVMTASYITSSNIAGRITAFSSSWASASISASNALTAAYLVPTNVYSASRMSVSNSIHIGPNIHTILDDNNGLRDHFLKVSLPFGAAQDLYKIGVAVINPHPYLTEMYIENQDGAGTRLSSMTMGVNWWGEAFIGTGAPSPFRIIDTNSAEPHTDLLVAVGGTQNLITVTNLYASSSITSSIGGFKGNLTGTASWASNALTAAYLNTANFSASWASQSLSASWAPGGTPTYTSSLWGTASWAVSASWAPSSDVVSTTSASYVSGSNSFIVNLSSSVITASAYYNYMPYTTVLTSSTNWITCSFNYPNQYVDLNVSGTTYSFTSSNHPVTGNFADIIVYLNNNIMELTNLVFPGQWKCANGLWPTSLTLSSSAIIWLRGYNNNTVIGTYHEHLIV